VLLSLHVNKYPLNYNYKYNYNSMGVNYYNYKHNYNNYYYIMYLCVTIILL